MEDSTNHGGSSQPTSLKNDFGVCTTLGRVLPFEHTSSSIGSIFQNSYHLGIGIGPFVGPGVRVQG